jgi:hypothetical protein
MGHRQCSADAWPGRPGLPKSTEAPPIGSVRIDFGHVPDLVWPDVALPSVLAGASDDLIYAFHSPGSWDYRCGEILCLALPSRMMKCRLREKNNLLRFVLKDMTVVSSTSLETLSWSSFPTDERLEAWWPWATT